MNLNTRWLISATDTFADCSADDAMRSLSVACSCSGFSDDSFRTPSSRSTLTPLNFSFASIETRCRAGLIFPTSKSMLVVVLAGITLV